MTSFLLMRHGEPDYSGPRKWDTPGWGADLAPLSELGEQQVRQQLSRIRQFDPDVVVTSPATRAIHSALVLRQELMTPFRVEFDLHEWVPDMTFQWRTLSEVEKLQLEYKKLEGEWPPGEKRPWERMQSVRSRAIGVFHKYISYGRVLVVCHGQLINAVTGNDQIELAGLEPFNL